MDFLQVGKIVNTHALQGEVKVVSNSDFKEDRFKKGSQLVIDFNGEYVDVTCYENNYHPYYAPKNAGYAAISNSAYGTYGNCKVKAYMVTTNAGSHSGRWLPAIY